jgi:hypothetical protein
MAINQNHLFEELGGVKCAIVEKNVKPARVAFLKKLLETNHFEVVAIPSPPPKAPPVAAPKPADAGGTPVTLPEPAISTDTANAGARELPEETFTIGVTDVTFNPTNAIFGRLLHTEDGHVVTLAYWQQKDKISHDDIPYYEKVRI